MTRKQKEIQKELNNGIMQAVTLFNKCEDEPTEVKRLRSCSAYVYKNDNFIWLKSYQTIVAFISLETGEMFDVLRYVYGYTSTSAQHIAKFRQDYRKYINDYYTYYSVD